MISRAVPSVRVLVTGFGPFPGTPENASAAMMKALARSPAAPGIELFTGIVPVVWADARSVAREAAAEVRPHAILHFGVSKRASGFEIETRAVNMSGPRQDHAGYVRPGKPLDLSGQRILHATMPPYALLMALRQSGFPAQLSRNAGRYLCNALFYWSLADARADGALVSFIHMPALGMDAGVRPLMTLEGAAAGALVLIRASAQAVLLAKRGGNGNRGGYGSHGSQAFHGTGRNDRRALWR
ncbi:MAG: pyroglutamyl-peptidase I [Rhodomicrobium sp.]